MIRRFLVVFVLVGLVLSGCKNSKNAGKKEVRNVGDKKVQFILSKISENEANKPKSISFKSATELKTKDKTTTFKASVRMVPDSVIWMSITAYSYEVARIIATPDSIKYVSRTDKKFYVGGYEFVENKLGVAFSFNDLQSLFLANSFGLENSDGINKRNSKNSYVLSSMNKRQLKKIQKGKELYPTGVDVLYTNWVNPETYQVEKVSLMDVNTQNRASIQYLTFENLLQYVVLTSFKMDIIAESEIEITSSFSKITVDVPLKFPFKISSKYVQITE